MKEGKIERHDFSDNEMRKEGMEEGAISHRAHLDQGFPWLEVDL